MMDGWMTGWLAGWYSHPIIQPHDATAEAERMGGLRSPLGRRVGREGEQMGRG